jgi:hypothetical protein
VSVSWWSELRKTDEGWKVVAGNTTVVSRSIETEGEEGGVHGGSGLCCVAGKVKGWRWC